MPNFNQLDFSQCQSTMQRVGIPFSASEAHGIVGMISGALQARDAAWQAELYAEIEDALASGDILVTECRDLLDSLYVAAQDQMQDEAFGLQLFLPNDETTDYSINRLSRLGARLPVWCRSCRRASQAKPVSGQSRGIAGFLCHCAVDVSGNNQSDESVQQAQTEIEEYLRMPALMIHADMQISDQQDD